MIVYLCEGLTRLVPYSYSLLYTSCTHSSWRDSCKQSQKWVRCYFTLHAILRSCRCRVTHKNAASSSSFSSSPSSVRAPGAPVWGTKWRGPSSISRPPARSSEAKSWPQEGAALVDCGYKHEDCKLQPTFYLECLFEWINNWTNLAQFQFFFSVFLFSKTKQCNVFHIT